MKEKAKFVETITNSNIIGIGKHILGDKVVINNNVVNKKLSHKECIAQVEINELINMDMENTDNVAGDIIVIVGENNL